MILVVLPASCNIEAINEYMYYWLVYTVIISSCRLHCRAPAVIESLWGPLWIADWAEIIAKGSDGTAVSYVRWLFSAAHFPTGSAQGEGEVCVARGGGLWEAITCSQNVRFQRFNNFLLSINVKKTWVNFKSIFGEKNRGL